MHVKPNKYFGVEYIPIIKRLPVMGYVLSPLLFDIFLELIIASALEDEEIGVQIGGVRINNLCFADDTALLAESPNKLQAIVNRVVEVSENLGLKVNIEETEIQHMGRAHKDFNIVIKNQNLRQTVNFAYLGGSLISKEGTVSDIRRAVIIKMKYRSNSTNAKLTYLLQPILEHLQVIGDFHN
ncbi:hypothetical protein U0070_027259 [Myodes glareolus]|uniref:Reverse transcriptase domain-containing protein n=1 Tax=Myodes glareolus TaxID=447135 RepID=A0AAW0HJQ7_MYOGA